MFYCKKEALLSWQTTELPFMVGAGGIEFVRLNPLQHFRYKNVTFSTISGEIRTCRTGESML